MWKVWIFKSIFYYKGDPPKKGLFQKNNAFLELENIHFVKMS